MLSGSIDLSSFNNKRDSTFTIGRPFLTQAAWFFAGLPILRSSVLSSSRARVLLLRLFGAEIGEGAVIKPGVRVKFPWKLKIGNHSWLGEDCWIDNLAPVTLGNHVCLSQGVYLCTGSHDWSDPAFVLQSKPIRIGDGAWIAARAVLAPGTVVGQHAVIGLNSMASGDIPPFEIHVGNPARFVRRREIRERPDLYHPEKAPAFAASPES